MKILVLNYEFPPVGGGGGRASADLCAALARRGHEVRVLTTWAPRLPRRESREGYQILRVFTGRRSPFRASFVAMGGYLVGGFLPGLRQVRGWRPDLVHAHFAVPTGVLAYAISRLTKVPFALTAHLGDVPGGVPEKTGGWFKFVYPFTPLIWEGAAVVVAVSAYTRELALNHYDVPIEVIPNGVRLPDTISEPLSVSDPPRMIFAGRFQPQKNLPFLVETLARVRDLPWRCTLCGDGPERGAVERLVVQHGLGGRIERTGWVSSEEVWQHLGESDLLVMPSRSEGLPVVGVQALAHGLAVVATRAGGLTELVEDGVNGRLCDVGDGACFEAGLRWCLEDRDRLRRLKGVSRSMAKRYEIDRVAQAYERLFDQVVG